MNEIDTIRIKLEQLARKKSPEAVAEAHELAKQHEAYPSLAHYGDSRLENTIEAGTNRSRSTTSGPKGGGRLAVAKAIRAHRQTFGTYDPSDPASNRGSFNDRRP